MPPIASFTIAYVCGLLVGSLAHLPVAGPVVVGGAGAIVAAANRWWGLLMATWAVGMVVSAGTLRARGADCGTVWPRGRIAALVAWHDAPNARGTATATVRHAARACRGLLRLRLGPGVESRAVAGARVVVVGSHRGNGVVSVGHVRVLEGDRNRRYVVRDALARRIERLYGPRAPVVEALVLGRKDGIPPDLRLAFVGSGLAHLLAISGLHVGVMAGWIVIALRAVGVRRGAAAGTAGVVWAYVALLGFPASATRAATFVTLVAVSRWRQRHPPPTAVLSVAVLVVVTVDPESVTAVGAWLSAAAVWGVSRAGRLVPERWAHQPVVRLLAASLGATVATTPVTAWTFGQVAPVGLATNLVAVPLAGVAVPGVFASLIVGDLLAGGAGLALAGLEACASVTSALPGAQIVGDPGLRFAAPWAALLMAFAYLTAYRRARARQRHKVVILIRWAAAMATAAWVVPVVRDMARGGAPLEMHVLDVGQGDAIALRTPRGRWMLVDGGPLGQTVVPKLRRLGVRRLVALMVSHGDADHLGGVSAAVAALAPELVLEPGQPLPSKLYQDFLMTVEATGVPWRPARAGDTVTVDSVSMAVLHPAATWVANHVEPNENSLVVHLRYGCFDALLTGDIGAVVERRLSGALGPMDLLKVAHHGSAGSSTAAFLDATRAPVAVISVGRGNRYGHPAPAAVQRLENRGSRVYRTDRGGAVTIRTDGRYLQVQQGRAQSFGETILCRIRRWSRSSASFSNRSACTPEPPVSLPICSTTSPSPGR